MLGHDDMGEELEVQASAGRVEEEPFFLGQIAEMTRHLAAVRDLPGLERLAETAELPAAFFEHFNAALACYDRLIAFALAYDGTDQRVQCKKGCCDCCIDLVRGITTPEIVNIYHHVRDWPDVQQIFEYHRDSAERFMALLVSKMQPGQPPPRGDDPRIREAHMQYNRLNRPCGFLDRETGCCRIYAVRPIACRHFFSLDPPQYCTPLHPKYFSRDTRTVHLPPEIHELLRSIGRRFGFVTLNYLSGGFCALAAEVMRTRRIGLTE